MRKTYELTPIPPFRGARSIVATTTPSSTCSSTLSMGSQGDSSPSLSPSTTEEREGSHHMASCFTHELSPSNQMAPNSSSPLTCFALNRKRRAPLDQLPLTNNRPLDPHGLSGAATLSLSSPEHLINGRAAVQSPTSLRTPCSTTRGGNENRVTPILAPIRTDKLELKPKAPTYNTVNLPERRTHTNLKSFLEVRSSGFSTAYPANFSNPQGHFPVPQPVVLSNCISLAPQAPPFRPTEFHLTPPPTPIARELLIQNKPENSHDPAPVDLNPLSCRHPLTPNTSPFSKSFIQLSPLTVSGKALGSHQLHEVFRSNYILEDELGSGGFGFVVQATRRKDGLKCAVKFIYKDKVPHHAWVKDELWGDERDVNGVTRTPEGIKRVPLEAYVLKTIRHRGVVSFVDLFEDKSYIYLVMEHHGTPWVAVDKENKTTTAPTSVIALPSLPISQKMQPLQPVTNGVVPFHPLPLNSLQLNIQQPPKTGIRPQLYVPMPPMTRRSSCDLFECIEQHSRLPEHRAKYVFAQLIDVVGCLHYNGFVHRDIKDENIVIDEKWRVKLVDFGSTYLFDYRKEVKTLTRFFGTLNFAAPEIVKKGAYQPMAAEIWSLGILLTILVSGESFFRDVEAIKAYRASPPSCPISESCMDLIFHCLAYNPHDRWNCFKIRTHPWLADCQWPWSEMPVDACTESINKVRR